MPQTRLPTRVSPALQLKEYLDLVRELSLTRSPAELLRSYQARSQFVVESDRIVSLSRRGMSDGQVKITRSTTWSEAIDPWKHPDRLPVVDSGFFLRLINDGEPVRIDRLEVDSADPAAPYLDGMQSLLASPIYHEGRPLYMVVMMRAAPASFTVDNLCTLVLTSNLLGRATSQLVLSQQLERAYEALDREFSMVGAIQRQLLPSRLPEIPGITIATHYETSTRAGGDYYNLLELPDGRLGVLIADVSGHGASAAVVVAMIHALLQAPQPGCPTLTASPAQVLQHLNVELSKSVTGEQFVTAFMGVLDTRTGTFVYSNAGHHPPRWLQHDVADPVPLRAESGLPLAIVDGLEYAEGTAHFKPGDRLLLYTDGITETFDKRGEMFGIEGIDAALRCCSRTPTDLIDSIMRGVWAYDAGAAAEDDRTLVALAID